MEITQLLKVLLTEDQLASLRKKEACSCKGVPPVVEGSVCTCDQCDGTGEIEVNRRFFLAHQGNEHLKRINIPEIGDVAVLDN